ncbi:DUF2393 family protein [Granulicella sp. dw_53]|uniref:DUF2393 family protein n=1 Tax=Granulicella sp. dw_53 TaxID=2719792 RepID=UPI001BD31478|nr:DUF2393 family protein [Granulicella sp. dw_53]
MSDPQTGTVPTQNSSAGPALFAPKRPESGGIPMAAWAIAGVVVLVVVGVLLYMGRSKSSGAANAILPADPYAATLPLSGLAMSESANISGGKYTYIDGHVRNTGSQTVTAATVQVLFRNEEQMPPQVETLPLALIRTHEPYIDTQPISAAPLKPGDDREFRLIFETIPGNWNYQMPEIHVTRVQTR